MVSNRFLGSIGNAIDSAASGTFLAKRASGPVFETLDYSDISDYPTGADVDSAAIINLIDSNFLSTRTPGTDITTVITDSGLNHIVPDSAGEVVKIGNYSKGISNVFADSGTTIKISSHTISLSTDHILLDGGTAASDYSGGSGAGGSSFSWGGDRALCAGGNVSGTNLSSIDYFDITTPGNAQDFGDLGASHNAGGSASNKTRGVIAGEENSNRSDRIEYLTIASLGNATDFGNLSVGRNAVAGVSDGTYGVFLGGSNISNSLVNTIDYITIASTGNATDFGDTNQAMNEMGAGNDATRGVIADNDVNWEMQYVTIATPGNTTDFGDLSVGRYGLAKGIDDGTYIVFAGGLNGGVSNVMDYITVQTPGNATDFGDLLAGYLYPDGASNGTRGVVTAGYTSGGTNTIQYITIATPGNATDFGDLINTRYEPTALSGNAS